MGDAREGAGAVAKAVCTAARIATPPEKFRGATQKFRGSAGKFGASKFPSGASVLGYNVSKACRFLSTLISVMEIA